MQVDIRDRSALLAVSPPALSAYARVAGWKKQEPYRVHSDVYVGMDLPEIMVPRTEHLGDYANLVAMLIDTFAEVAGQDELTVYRSLVTADRDVVRIRAAVSDDGSVTLNAGVNLVGSAATCCWRWHLRFASHSRSTAQRRIERPPSCLIRCAWDRPTKGASS